MLLPLELFFIANLLPCGETLFSIFIIDKHYVQNVSKYLTYCKNPDSATAPALGGINPAKKQQKKILPQERPYCAGRPCGNKFRSESRRLYLDEPRPPREPPEPLPRPPRAAPPLLRPPALLPPLPPLALPWL
ncbi:hypothetical protein M2105_000868 [Paenibacillus sp. PastF-1]|nr:hypothetical protein [Paenibacillus sp. PastF-2]MDF9846626.1 hypothetical protein [Paenibacillus sp. PastM-2]MDF9853026.1 hypothetical protein [Paenibacillus sp. PastF-1]MDH6478470.1 hypothetical protein [Paenibacillus sp. PastH-2]MDH6506032.1 hypothetical protein [Paenibacillus sp. PastM-3]